MQNARYEADYLRLRDELQKGRRRPVYVFTGKEEFLIDEAVSRVRASMLSGQSRNVDFSGIHGPDASLEQVLDMADTASLFGGGRLVVVKEAPYFGKGSQTADDTAKRLLDRLAEKDSPSCIIFCAPEFNRAKKGCKEIAASGALYVFDSLKPAALTSWLQERLASHGKTAPAGVLSLLVERVGRDMRRLASETDKLAAYLGARRELDEKSVLSVAARSIQGDIFALTDAVVYGATHKALLLLKDLLSAGEPPLRILAMLVRQFRLLGEALELVARGCDHHDLTSRLAIHPYAAEKLYAQARKTNEQTLSRAVDVLLQADLDIKRGRVDQTLALETVVVALGQKSA